MSETTHYYSVHEAEEAIKAQGYVRSPGARCWVNSANKRCKVMRDDNKSVNESKFFVQAC